MIHVPSMVGRAVADRGPLLLSTLVLGLAAVLAGAVPPAAGRAADAAIADAVRRAGADASVVAAVPLESEEAGGLLQRQPRSALLTDATFRNTRLVLPPELAAVLRPPVAWITSAPLEISGRTAGHSLVLAYVSSQSGDPRVTWTSGRPPGASVPPERAEVQRPAGSAPWPVEIGLAEPAAAALHVGAGERLDVADERHQHVDVRVTGVYRVADPQDPAWQPVPILRTPSTVAGSAGTSFVTVAGLLSRDSLPDARIALDEDEVTRHVGYQVEPTRVTAADAGAVAAAAVRLQGAAGSGGAASVLPAGTRWDTGLVAVLRRGRGDVEAALAQAATLLGGLVAAAALVLVLAAALLARRRGPVLGGARERGAGLAGIALELGAESTAAALVALVAGALAARASGGSVAWGWLLPVLAVGVVASPAAGALVAGRVATPTRGPANRSARRSLLRTRRLRRATLEVAVALLAVAAFVALRQRGAGSGGDVLPAVAPVLGALTGALLLRRLVPPAARLGVRLATRSPRVLPLVAAARAASPGAGGPAFVAVAVCAAVLVLPGAVVATQDARRAQVAAQSVGADVRLNSSPSPAVADLAARLADAPGVRHAVAARVTDAVPVLGDAGGGSVRLVVVDARAYADLVESLAAGQGAVRGTEAGAALRALAGAGAASAGAGAGGAATGVLPALLRTSQPGLVASRSLRLVLDDGPHPLRIVGTGPPGGDALVVDRAAWSAAGLDPTPDTVWLTGPAAGAAAAAVARPGLTVTRRADVERDLASAPIARALRGLGVVSAVVLAGLAVLAVALGAAAGAPERGVVLARLRTLGLRRRAGPQLVLAELLPPAALAVAGGLLVGALVAQLSTGLLGAVAGTALVVPWWPAGIAILVLGTLAAVAAVESAARRREGLGQVLRVGGG